MKIHAFRLALAAIALLSLGWIPGSSDAQTTDDTASSETEEGSPPTPTSRTPGWQSQDSPPRVSPEEAEAILQRESNQFEQERAESARHMERIFREIEEKKANPDSASLIDAILGLLIPSANAVEAFIANKDAAADAEVTSLALALKGTNGANSPAVADRIYQYVYNNIAFEPTYGAKKGAVGTLLDKSGNAFDQATLMVELLKKAGFSASNVNYRFGSITLSANGPTGGVGFEPWLGVSTAADAATILEAGGIPVSVSGSSITFSHVWVRVNLSGQSCASNCVFNPSIKSRTNIAVTDLIAAMSFNEANFLADARAGATIDLTTNNEKVKNLNNTNIRSSLSEYATNLINYIRTNIPDATVVDVIGGWKIDPTAASVRQISIPGQTGSIQTWPAIPNSYHTYLTLSQWPESGCTPYTFPTQKTSDIYGRRLTITFDASNRLKLNLDGTTIATSTIPVTQDSALLVFAIDHPGSTSFDQPGYSGCAIYGGARIGNSGTYSIVNAWGRTGTEIIEKRRKWLGEYVNQGDSESAETVLGESLGIIGWNFLAQGERIHEILDRVTGSPFSHVIRHRVGIAGYRVAPYLDMRFISTIWPEPNLEMRNGRAFSLLSMASALEHGTIEQRHAFDAVSMNRVIFQTNNNGNWIYDIDPLTPCCQQLFGYTPAEVNIIGTAGANNRSVLVPENGSIQIGSWTGAGMYVHEDITATGGGGATIISGFLDGGVSAEPGPVSVETIIQADPIPDESESHEQSVEPVDLVTGDYLYSHSDLGIGSMPSPVGLAFRRTYNSADRLVDRGMGLGWRHSFDIAARLDSSGAQGLGEDSPIDTAAAIAALYTSYRILDNNRDPDRLVISILIHKWLMDKLTDNVVVVDIPGSEQQYVKLSDGSFNPPPGVAATLNKEFDGSYKLTGKDDAELDFNISGNLATWKNRNGNTISLGYTAGGKLSTISNDFQRQFTLSYSGNRISTITDDAGRSISYGYDGSGRLTNFTDAENAITTYEYDANKHRLTKIFYPQRPNTAIVTNAYDSMDRVKTQTNAFGGDYDFYLAGTSAEERGPLSHRRTWEFDSYGNTTKDTDFYGSSTVMIYDVHRRLTKVSLPDTAYPDHNLKFKYDSLHNLTELILKPKPGALKTDGTPMTNATWAITYHGTYQDRIDTITDPLGNVTDFDYWGVSGGLGLLRSVTQPPAAAGGTAPLTQFAYTTSGLLETITDPEGKVTKLGSYTAKGNPQSLIENFGGLSLTTTLGYDPVGNIKDITDSLGNNTHLTYDDERRLITVTAPPPFAAGIVTEIDYDLNGQVKELRRKTDDPNPPNDWAKTLFSYAADDKLLSATDPRGHVTQYAYDTLRRLDTVTDGVGRQTKFVYFNNSQLKKVRQYSGGWKDVEEYTYTPNGRIQTVNDGNNNTTTYSYNGFDRLDRVTYPGGTYEQNTFYDDVGNVTQYRTRAGNLINYQYDNLYRLKQMTLPGNLVTTYGYDLTGRIKDLVDAATGLTLHYDYDTAGRLDLVTDQNNRVVNYDYDAAGNRSRLTYPDGFYVNYEYDQLNRLDKIKEGAAGLLRADYDWTALSQVKQVKRYAGSPAALLSTSSYAYELDGDLKSLGHQLLGSAPSWTFTYNGAGQVSVETGNAEVPEWTPPAAATVTYTSNTLNQYTAVGGVTHSYTGDGSLWTVGGSFPSYGYDVEGRMTAATLSGTLSAAYGYDPRGLRASKTVTVSGTPTTTRYLYDGAEAIAEYDGNNPNQVLARYVYGPGIDQPLFMERGGERYFYHPDRLGSVAVLTDDAGMAVEEYAYGPFGETDGASAYGNPYRYTGREYEPETGLYYYRARHYSPELGRFMQPDPIGYYDSLNLYGYVGNDSFNATDPSGLVCTRSTATCSVDMIDNTPIEQARLSGVITEWLSADIARLEARMTDAYRITLANPTTPIVVPNAGGDTVVTNGGGLVTLAEGTNVNVSTTQRGTAAADSRAGSPINVYPLAFRTISNDRIVESTDWGLKYLFLHELLHQSFRIGGGREGRDANGQPIHNADFLKAFEVLIGRGTFWESIGGEFSENPKP